MPVTMLRHHDLHARGFESTSYRGAAIYNSAALAVVDNGWPQ